MTRIMLSITMICVMIYTSSDAYSEDSYEEVFLKKIRIMAIADFCSSESFVSVIGDDDKQCVRLLSAEAEYCNSLLRPFLPNEDYEGNALEIFRKLGELYGACVKGNALENYLHTKEQ